MENELMLEGASWEEERSPIDESQPLRLGIIAALAVAALVSLFALSGIFSTPDAYPGTIQTLDDKKVAVLALTATAISASAAVSAIPDDTGTPIAERLADLSADFGLILTVIFLEKYLLTTFGLLCFAVFIPVSCVLAIAAILLRKYHGPRDRLGGLAKKLALMGVLLWATIPLSTMLSNNIEATYNDTAYDLVASVEATPEGAEIVEDLKGVETTEDQAGALDSLVGFLEARAQDIQDAAATVQEGVSNLLSWAQNKVTSLAEALSILIVTSCVIPLLTLALFLWGASLITGADLGGVGRNLTPRSIRRMSGTLVKRK